MTEVDKAVKRVRDAKAALVLAEATCKAAREAFDAASRKVEVADRERYSAENSLLAVVNGEPAALLGIG